MKTTRRKARRMGWLEHAIYIFAGFMVSVIVAIIAASMYVRFG